MANQSWFFLETYTSVIESLDKMGTNYIDLFLIHWAECIDDFEWMDCSEAKGKSYKQSWEMMEKLFSEGVLLNIGVSNFDFDLFEDLIKSSECQIIPQVVQNYFDISHQDWEFIDYLDTYGTIFQGYATYRGIAEADVRIEDEPHYMEWKERLNNIAKTKELDSTSGKSSVTASQVLLRWLIESGVSVTPRTQSLQHLQENWNIWNFQLSQAEIQQLLDKSVEEIDKRMKSEL